MIHCNALIEHSPSGGYCITTTDLDFAVLCGAGASLEDAKRDLHEAIECLATTYQTEGNELLAQKLRELKIHYEYSTIGIDIPQ